MSEWARRFTSSAERVRNGGWFFEFVSACTRTDAACWRPRLWRRDVRLLVLAAAHYTSRS
jgi:hypothetical protein